MTAVVVVAQTLSRRGRPACVRGMAVRVVEKY